MTVLPSHLTPQSGPGTFSYEPALDRLHLLSDGALGWEAHIDGRGYKLRDFSEPPRLEQLLGTTRPNIREEGFTQVLAAIAARNAAVHDPDPTFLELFGHRILGLPRSPQWTEAVSTALLGDWTTLLYDGTGVPRDADLGPLRREARSIHRQMVPLWRRRTYGNRRVLLLEKPSPSGTLRDLLADRALPDDHVLDQIPGDRRLVILLDRLAPPERAVVLAFGHPGVVTWADAAGHTGSAEPEQDGDKVRRKVRRALRELCRRDEQRSDGPTGLWSPARHGGAQ